MKEIYLVTGNPGKLRELQAIFPSSLRLIAKELDLDEIQSMDSEEIVRDKLERAYALVKKHCRRRGRRPGLPERFARPIREVL